jgi:hypothetical protein
MYFRVEFDRQQDIHSSAWFAFLSATRSTLNKQFVKVDLFQKITEKVDKRVVRERLTGNAKVTTVLSSFPASFWRAAVKAVLNKGYIKKREKKIALLKRFSTV